MSVRPYVSISCVVLAIAGFQPTAFAATLTVNDACGSSISGTPGATPPTDPVRVDSSGNIVADGLVSTTYSAGFGMCDPLPVDGKAICHISASQTKVARNTPVTLHARCTQNPGEPLTYIWMGPSDPSLPGSDVPGNTLTLSFPNPGVYTYSVTGKRAGVSGKASSPVTILVGDASDKPNCVLTFSPITLPVHNDSTAQIACHPAATTFNWDAVDAGAPAAPASSVDTDELTFDTVGTFAYRVSGTNANGEGPKTGAMVTTTSSLAWRSSNTKAGGGTLNFPAGTTPTDVLVLYMVGTTSAMTTPPAGWGPALRTLTWSSPTVTSAVYTRLAGADTSVALGASSVHGLIVAYSGGVTGGVSSTFTETAASATSCARSVTGLSPASIIVSIVTDRDAVNPTVPSGYTSRATLTGGVYRNLISDKPSINSSSGSVSSTIAAGASGACILVEVKP